MRKISPKKLMVSAGLLTVSGLLMACGYNTPQGGGGLTPYVVVVTPTATPILTTTVAQTKVATTTIPPTSTAPVATPTTAAITVAGLDGNTYTVQKGDTLHGIANKLHVDYQQLLKINNITDPDKLQIGQQLKVPATTNT